MTIGKLNISRTNMELATIQIPGVTQEIKVVGMKN